ADCELLTQMLLTTVLLSPSKSQMPLPPLDSQTLLATTLYLSPLSPSAPIPLPALPANTLLLTTTCRTPAPKYSPSPPFLRTTFCEKVLSLRPPPGCRPLPRQSCTRQQTTALPPPRCMLMPSLGQPTTQHPSTRESVASTRWMAAKVNPSWTSELASGLPPGRPSMTRSRITIRDASLAVIAGKQAVTSPPLAGSYPRDRPRSRSNSFPLTPCTTAWPTFHPTLSLSQTPTS